MKSRRKNRPNDFSQVLAGSTLSSAVGRVEGHRALRRQFDAGPQPHRLLIDDSWQTESFGLDALLVSQTNSRNEFASKGIR